MIAGSASLTVDPFAPPRFVLHPALSPRGQSCRRIIRATGCWSADLGLHS